MKATMYVILSTNNTQSCNEVVNILKEFYSTLSIYPKRDYYGMENALEFYVTFDINKDDLKIFLNHLSDSFDEDEDQWECYRMTSKIFHKDIDYIRINIYA